MKFLIPLLLSAAALAQNLILVSGPGPVMTGTMHVTRINLDLTSTAIISQRVTAGNFLAISLRSNTSTLAGTYYKVIYNNVLNETVVTEFWTVPATPATNTRSAIFSASTGGLGVLSLNGLSGALTFPSPEVNNTFLSPNWNSSASALKLGFPLASTSSSVTAGLLTGAEYAAFVSSIALISGKAQASVGACPAGQHINQIFPSGVPSCTADVGGISGIDFLSNTTLVGTQAKLDFLPDVNLSFNVVNVPGSSKVTVQAIPNTATLLTKKTFQDGTPIFCASTIPSGTTHVCSLSPALVGYTLGQTFTWQPSGTMISGAQNLNIDLQGALPLKKIDGSDPGAGDIVAGRIYTLVKLSTSLSIISGIQTSSSSGPITYWHPAASINANLEMSGTVSSIQAVVTNSVNAGAGLRANPTEVLYTWHYNAKAFTTINVIPWMFQTDQATTTGNYAIDVAAACVAAPVSYTSVTMGTTVSATFAEPAWFTFVTPSLSAVTPAGTCVAGGFTLIRLTSQTAGTSPASSGAWRRVFGVAITEN